MPNLAAPEFAALTPRENEILRGIVGGNTNKQIARNLGISYRTVEVHRRHVLTKFGARNTAELVRMVHSPLPNKPND